MSIVNCQRDDKPAQMSPACTLVSLRLLLIACLLNTSRALPIPTTPLPPIPRRFIDPTFEKDGFSLDYQDVSKRSTLAQQAHENVKKFNRNWGPPASNEYYDSGFYGANPYKEQDSRSYIETNSIPQENKYYNSYEVEGYFPDEDFSILEDENNYIDPIYSLEVSTASSTVPNTEPLQGSYQSDSQLLSPYQTISPHPSIYVGNDLSTKEYEYSSEIETECDIDISREDNENDFDEFNAYDIPTIAAPLSINQPHSQSNKSLQKSALQGGKQGTSNQQLANTLDAMQAIPDWENGEMEMKMKARDLRPSKSSIRNFLTTSQPPLLPPPPGSPPPQPPPLKLPSTPTPPTTTPSPPHSPQVSHPTNTVQHSPSTTSHTSNPPQQQSISSHSPAPTSQESLTNSPSYQTSEEPTLVDPKENVQPKEIFSRTTTITKTTTWYANGDEEIIVFNDMESKPQHIKAKYTKTTKTTTSGPAPWYLQGFEDVIFEEENGKSKTILDKMSNLKSLNPTSITSFTTAPNPWSSEVHEEVVFEEMANPKDSFSEADLKAHYSGPHPSPLENIVEYLPRTHKEPTHSTEELAKEETVRDKHNNGNKEESAKEEFIIEIVPVEIVPYADPVVGEIIAVVDTDIQPHPPHSQFYISPQLLPHLESEVGIEDEQLPLENHLINPIITSQKPVNENFIPHTQVAHHNGDQSYISQPSTHLIPDQNYLPTQSNYLSTQGYPNLYSSSTPNSDRREKWEPRNDHQTQQNWENYQNSNVDLLQSPHQQQKIEMLPKDDLYRMQRAQQMSSQEAKRSVYQNRQFPNRPTRPPRDL